MTSFIESIAYAVMYGLLWLVISCGCTFIIAAAFFGFPEEKDNKPRKPKKDLKCPITGGQHIVTVMRKKHKENQDDI